jgi:ribosomal protein S18 acetylase RimI-like enzyme
MSLILHVVVPPETEALLPILQDADEDVGRIRTLLNDGKHTSYAVCDGEKLIGAATLCWTEDDSEIEYIAVASGLRGRGYGKAIITALLEEAQQRRVCSLLVGTANSSLDTIAFYQKCGFRMDSVRHDFFSYVQPPLIENGIPMRDMLMLRYDLNC